jgi:hypothetical protein
MGRLGESHSLDPCGLLQWYSLHRRHVTALLVICWELDAETLDRSHLQGVDPVEVFDRCGDGNGLFFPA